MSDKRALIIGIGHYKAPGDDLAGAAADAGAIATLLSSHQDGSPNYNCRLLADAMDDGGKITRAALREPARTSSRICDSEDDDWGVPMDEIVTLANKSDAANILTILGA